MGFYDKQRKCLSFCLKIIAICIYKDGWMSTYSIDKIYEFDEYQKIPKIPLFLCYLDKCSKVN